MLEQIHFATWPHLHLILSNQHVYEARMNKRNREKFNTIADFPTLTADFPRGHGKLIGENASGQKVTVVVSLTFLEVYDT